jgi:hypothetical protein
MAVKFGFIASFGRIFGDDTAIFTAIAVFYGFLADFLVD